MTLLAGAFAMTGTLTNGDAWFAEMSAVLSRDPDDRRDSVRDARGFLIKVDIGAYGVPARHEEQSVTTFVTGEPMIPAAPGERRDRATDTRAVHRALLAHHDDLRRTRGLFSAAQYDRARGRMSLATDRLGIRPIYYALRAGVLVFASSLRVMEALTFLDKEIDPRGLAEQLALRYPLADRTPYRDVCMLLPGEVVECDARGVRKREYWRWQDIRPLATDITDVARKAYDAFVEGVRLRQGTDTSAIAFLSGGLDSRCVVAALREIGNTVYSFNFISPGYQDSEYARAFAECIGSIHAYHRLERFREPIWTHTLVSALKVSEARTRVERPRLAWSGDGGSVGVGHLHLSRAMTELADSGNEAGAVDRYMVDEQITTSRNLLQDEVRDFFMAAPRRGIMAEIDRLRVPEIAQSLYFFLMQSNQRRLAQTSFEEVDILRMELQRPFFDVEFLAVIATIPVRERVGHAFYVRHWLPLFSSCVTQIPWQAYPGHVPCPVPQDPSLGYQWDEAHSFLPDRPMRKFLSGIGWRILTSRRFAGDLLRRDVLFAAVLGYWSRFRDYSYVIRAAETIQHASDVARGRISSR